MLKVPIDSLHNENYEHLFPQNPYCYIAIAIFITSSIVVAVPGKSLHVCIFYILCS